MPYLVVAVVAVVLTVVVVVVTAPSSHARQPSINLLVGDQATFQSSTGGWVGYGVGLRHVRSPVYGTGGSLEVSPHQGVGPDALDAAYSGAPPTAVGQPAPTSGSVPSPGLTRARAGLVYRGSAVAETVAGDAALAVAPTLGFWDRAGNPLAYVPGADVMVSHTWTDIGTAWAVAPAGATYVAVGVQVAHGRGRWRLSVGFAELTDVRDVVPAVTGPLHVQGTQIVQPDGVPVVLRGIDYITLDASPTPASLTEGTFTRFRQWGFTLVRISVDEDWWLPQSCAYAPGYEAAVTKAVGWATAQGMVALVDLHKSSAGDLGAVGSCPPARSQPAPDVGAAAFWASAASAFAGNPLVAFDLFNEPHDVSFPLWLDGGEVDGYQAVGLQHLYDVVRLAGAQNLVFVEGTAWANDPPPPQYMLTGTGIVYDAHWYTCQLAPPPDCDYRGSDPATSTTGLEPWVPFQRDEAVPVFVGEFGWPSKQDGTFVNAVIDFAEGQGWGWDVFAYDGTDYGHYDLVAPTPSSGLFEPSPAGMPVLADLAQHAPAHQSTAASTTGNGTG